MYLPTATSELKGIRDGSLGTRDTLRIMSRLVNSGKKMLPVRELALSIVGGLRQKDYGAEVRLIHAFVRDKIRYVRDVRGVETLHSADKIIEYEQGDCDDKSILVASLLESIGHPTRFVAVGFKPSEAYNHVLVETRIGIKWIALECTEPVSAGWSPPGVTWRMLSNN